jgi:hypothetical protein
MQIQQDYKELLELFNAHNVDYVIVGGYALAFHGAPRFTGDIDLFVKPDPKNAQRILSALTEFGMGSLDLSQTDFTSVDNVIQLGVPPVRVDIMTSLTGVGWDKADSGKVTGNYGDIKVYFIGRDDFIANKRALGRKRDLADLEAIEQE